MLSCLRPLPPSSSNSHFASLSSQGYYRENSWSSSDLVSPTVNLSREYTLAVQTNSYSEIRRAFDHATCFDQNIEVGHVDFFEEPQLLEQILQPSRGSVQETLALIKPNSLTYLVSTYFEQSEHTSRLCLLIYHSVHRAHVLYTPIHTLLDDLQFDSVTYSLSHPQCNFAFNTFLQFDLLENPFLSPDSHNFNDMHQCFFQLRQKLEHYRRKSRSRFRLLCPAILPSTIKKKEMVRLAQLEAAARGAYVLHNDLDTIDRLVARLYTAIENDKLLVHKGSERGVERYTTQEILKQLRRNRPSFVQQLVDLEEHLFLCFAAINRARSLLLQEIHMHQDPGLFLLQ